jgi:hypothetical protein
VKSRTPQKNALLSIIPFFGYSSYVYLGKKLGLTGWGFNTVVNLGLVFLVTILGGIVMGFENIDTLIVFTIVMPASHLVQYFSIKKLTKIKHKRELQL